MPLAFNPLGSILARSVQLHSPAVSWRLKYYGLEASTIKATGPKGNLLKGDLLTVIDSMSNKPAKQLEPIRINQEDTRGLLKRSLMLIEPAGLQVLLEACDDMKAKHGIDLSPASIVILALTRAIGVVRINGYDLCRTSGLLAIQKTIAPTAKNEMQFKCAGTCTISMTMEAAVGLILDIEAPLDSVYWNKRQSLYELISDPYALLL